ncbi:HNH endonuclease [Paracoccus sp. MC1862]|uniref:HNH endonuclease n=1 Tax=Paracoccus sp. MC1862 TaxID=2760307 RepID=UPI001602DD99|nr:HNH endonuclease [Paracoccus sp. MC1862]MBB1499701.1 HNH endonuclease [Paracoccus sp. MC1862]
MFRVERWLEQTLDDFGIRLPGWRAPEGPAKALPPTANDQVAAVQALSLLDRITTEPERRAGYVRDDWPHWLDLDGDCRSARHEVLASESLKAVKWGASGCSVQSGAWRDAYTGQIRRNPRDLDIDHLVPLAEAHRSGGHAWSQGRRAAFANDLEDNRTLIAVGAATNRAKGDKGPEEWLPPLPASRCRYVADWVAVKARWSLGMDERERVMVGNILRNCIER